MKTPISCGFLIVRGNPISSFLLMKHPTRWDLPKGHVDPGESDEECALRELYEETGIRPGDIEIVPGFVYESQYPVAGRRYGGDGTVIKTLRIFLARLLDDAAISVTEHAGYEWFPWQPPHQIQPQTIDPLLAALQRFQSADSTD